MNEEGYLVAILFNLQSSFLQIEWVWPIKWYFSIFFKTSSLNKASFIFAVKIGYCEILWRWWVRWRVNILTFDIKKSAKWRWRGYYQYNFQKVSFISQIHKVVRKERANSINHTSWHFCHKLASDSSSHVTPNIECLTTNPLFFAYLSQFSI